ncbi:PEP-CTERM-box response regulator transcription factor [Thermoproteota archaeon]
MTKLLIVDDDQGILKQLKWALEGEYHLFMASDKEEALRIVNSEQPDIVALDVNLDGLNPTGKGGIDVLDEIKNHNSFAKVIMITGNDSKDVALEAINKGAFDYYLKPINIDELKLILKRATYIQELEKENKRLANDLEDKFTFEHIVGTSSKMEDVFRIIKRVSPTEATVLIAGESGTGKELAAKAIHFLSARKDKPFMVINCGAIPENLLESELFGHEKGSFTDAHAKRIGKLEVANKGTVFLDEIGEMSLNLQVKILRFLQERVIERVGGNAPIELDVRIIAATNSDLTQLIKDNRFREDLYYRLSVINIELPPLRDRGDDVFLLANYFLDRYKNEISNKDIKGFTKEAKDVLKSYGWPGNVREMDNKIKRALILAEGTYVSPSELGFDMIDLVDKNEKKLSLKEARQDLETELIKRALDESKGNMSLAAKMLGITRPTLYDLMKKYKINV